MGQESLTIVDARNRPLGTASRTFVHRNGLAHRSVHILVFDPAGRVLLQKRAPVKDESPGLWDSSAAGHVEAGEHYTHAARRELAEELGIRVRGRLRPLFCVPADAHTGWEFCTVYQLVHCGPLRPDPREIERVEWFTAGRLEGWLATGGRGLSAAFRAIWRLYMMGSD